MTGIEERIAGMVAENRITPQEGNELLEAAKTAKRPSGWAWILAPATRLSTGNALAFTLSLLLLSTGVAKLRNVRFDGTLDVHLSPGPLPWNAVALDALAYLPLTVAVFFVVSRLFGSRGRFVDLFVGVGLARVAPLLLAMATSLLLPVPPDSPAALAKVDGLAFAVLLLALPILVWEVTMLFFHFREASGLRGARLAAGFSIGVMAAEVISKLFLMIL